MTETIKPYTPTQFRNDYTDFYRLNTYDCPENSQTNLALLTLNRIKNGQINNVLNIGSGPQQLEHLLFNMAEKTKTDLKGINFMSLDIANIPRSLLKKPEDVHHMQANGSKLPLADSSIYLVMSNMALDFMPREVFPEIKRILKPEGSVLANLHHPKLIDLGALAVNQISSQLHTAYKQLKNAKRYPHSYKKEKIEQKIELLSTSLNDARFAVNILPAHIFTKKHDLMQFLYSYFPYNKIDVQEISDRINIWYQVQILNNN